MNKGDSIRLVLDFSVNGKEIEQEQFEEIELQLNKEGYGRYYVKLLLSQGDMEWDEELSKYVAFLPQEETLRLPEIVNYQLRCYKDDTVISSDIGHFHLGDVLSRRILPDGQ